MEVGHLKKKVDRQRRPRNVKFMREVKINNAVFNKISEVAKKRDAGCRKIQGLIAKSITAMARVAENVILM